MFSSIFKDLLGCFEIKSKTMQVTQLCVAKLRDMAYGYEKGKQYIPFLERKSLLTNETSFQKNYSLESEYNA